MAWSGEPQSRAPGEVLKFGTNVESVEDGFLVDGTKVFSTSATGAQWAILLVSLDGPGGIRHASGSLDSQLMLACDLSDPSVTVDGTWWDPIGMRATVSHLVRFNRTFIPQTHVIGCPGQYIREGWQTCFIPHYAATFLGAAEAAYEFAVEYVTSQKKGGDPYVQHLCGMSIRRDGAPVVTTRRAHVGDRKARGSADSGQPGPSRNRTPGRRHSKTLHPGLWGALSEPAECPGADLSGSVFLCPSRQ